MNELSHQVNQKDQYARSVSLFLAELLRTRKVSLKRAADIAQKVLENINLIDTEEQFLKFIKVISSDFEELLHLQNKISFEMDLNERKHLEDNVREFVINCIIQDVELATKILHETIEQDSSIDALCEKFPQFKTFIEKKYEPKPRSN